MKLRTRIEFTVMSVAIGAWMVWGFLCTPGTCVHDMGLRFSVFFVGLVLALLYRIWRKEDE
jgi:hypothetical protein